MRRWVTFYMEVSGVLPEKEIREIAEKELEKVRESLEI